MRIFRKLFTQQVAGSTLVRYGVRMATDSEIMLKISNVIRDSLYVYGGNGAGMSEKEKEIAIKTCEDFADFLIEVLDLEVVEFQDNLFTVDGRFQNPEDIF